MKLKRLNFDPKSGIRHVLITQLALAGLLIGSDLFDGIKLPHRERTVLPTGPVSPGDQTREYRDDRPTPSLVEQDGPLDLPVPDEFSNRLSFTEQTIEGYGNVLLVSGQIATGDADRLRTHLSEMGTPPDLVALHSPGGRVQESQDIGRHLRSQGLSTGVFAGAFCMSSCPYILAAGEERIVSLKSVVGMHQHYYDQPSLMPVIFAVEDIQNNQGETMEYLVEMGIDPSIMIYSLKTPPDQIYALVEEELSDTRIATEIIK